jgi:hypothetical protein
MQCTRTTEVSKAAKVLLRQPQNTTSRTYNEKSVSYSLASKEGRHKELSASLQGVRTSKDRSDTRRQGVGIEHYVLIVITAGEVRNKRSAKD